jgi:hypothetical protein
MKYIKTTLNQYINENTNIPIVYHASDANFDEFDISKITNIRGDLYGVGFYFSDNLEYVKQFGKILYECEINIPNPINLTDKFLAKKQLSYLLGKIENIKSSDKEYIEDSIEYKDFSSGFRRIRKYLSFNDLKKHFDGVIGHSEKGGMEYVVYHPQNIKIVNVNKI